MKLTISLFGCAIIFNADPAQAKCIQVEIEAPAPIINHSHSSQSLVDNIRLPKWAPNTWDAIAGRFDGQINVEYREMNTSQQTTACGTTQPFVMTLSITNSVINIAREIPRDGCWFGVIHSHENKHYQAQRDGLHRAALRLESAVETAIAQYADGDTTQPVYTAIETELNNMYQEIDRTDEQIDSLDAVLKENEKCGGGHALQPAPTTNVIR